MKFLRIMLSIKSIKNVQKIISTHKFSKFQHNIIHMFRANVLVQLIAIASLPLLSRLYSADNFGKLAYFLTVLSVLLSFVNLRYDWLIPNAISTNRASGLFILGCTYTVFTSIFTGIIFGFGLLPITLVAELGVWTWILPIGMICGGLISLIDSWYVRICDLKNISIARVSQSVCNLIGSIAGGLFKLESGLVISHIQAMIINLILLFRYPFSILRISRAFKKKYLTILLKKYSRQSLISTLVSVTNTASSAITIILITYWFGLKELGWYTLMLRLAGAPISLISSAIGQSFWAKAGELARHGQFLELRHAYLQTTRRLALFIFPILVVCSFGPFVIGPLLGQQEWGPAGFILLAIIPHLIGMTIFVPTNHLVVYGRQGLQLVSDLIVIVLSFCSVWLAAYWDLGIIICILLISLSILIGYIIRFIFHLKVNLELSIGTKL